MPIEVVSHETNCKKFKSVLSSEVGHFYLRGASSMGFPAFGQPFGTRFGRSFGQGGGQSIASLYRLLDTFDTARAAGSVNGTPAEPTGQLRTVTDGNNKLSITGGVLTFATGGVGAGDPGLWYSSLTTIAGMLITGTVIPGNNQSGIAIGFDVTAVGSIQDSIRLIGGNVVNVIAAGVGVAVGLYTTSATYQLTVIQRQNGDYYVIKGGTEFPFQTLIWINASGVLGTRFPAVGIATGTVGIATADNIRIPTALYIPSPLAYDDFNRANGALGSTITVGPDAQVLTALAWAFTAGIWAIVTNKAVGTPVPGADVVVNGTFAVDANWAKGAGWTIAAGVAAFNAGAGASITQTTGLANRWFKLTWTITVYVSGTLRPLAGSGVGNNRTSAGTFTDVVFLDNTSLGINCAGAGNASIDNVIYLPLTTAELFSSVAISTADVIADVAITSTSGEAVQAGLVLNLDSTSNPQNFILVYLDLRGNCIIQECVAGAYTTKQTTAITYSAGAVLRAVRDGTSCRVFYNNAAVGTVQAMTVNVNTKHGLFSTSALNSLDGFALWSRGTANEYGGLDQF